MNRTILPVFAVFAVVVFSITALLSGCATFVNGVRQPLEITAESPVIVSQKGKPSQSTPVTLLLNRNDHHLLTLHTQGNDSTTLLLRSKMNGWVWANLIFGLYGLAGMAIDLTAGGTYTLALKDSARSLSEFPTQVNLRWITDPRAYGTWHMSLGYFLGYKSFPERTVASGSGFDLGMQWVVGKNAWPLDLVAEGYLISSTWEMESRPTLLLNAGLRKTLHLSDGRIYPHASAGITWLSRSTQVGKGFPVGLWTRLGADLRLGQRVFIGPYIGYSKLEMVASSNAVNTAGYTMGLVGGLMW
jgi:hypothetical protein